MEGKADLSFPYISQTQHTCNSIDYLEQNKHFIFQGPLFEYTVLNKLNQKNLATQLIHKCQGFNAQKFDVS